MAQCTNSCCVSRGARACPVNIKGQESLKEGSISRVYRRDKGVREWYFSKNRSSENKTKVFPNNRISELLTWDPDLKVNIYFQTTLIGSQISDFISPLPLHCNFPLGIKASCLHPRNIVSSMVAMVTARWCFKFPRMSQSLKICLSLLCLHSKDHMRLLCVTVKVDGRLTGSFKVCRFGGMFSQNRNCGLQSSVCRL